MGYSAKWRRGIDGANGLTVAKRSQSAGDGSDPATLRRRGNGEAMDQPPLSNFATDGEPGMVPPAGPGARATPLRGAVVRPFTFAALTVAALFVLPVATVLANLFASSEGTWAHLAATVLPRYVANTAWLVLGVGLAVPVIGAGTAWLVTMFRFPGRRLFE